MTDLFNEPNKEDVPQLDPNKNYFEELVGEGKKFKDPEALAKGKAYADAMVDFKNKQYDELRAEFLRLSEDYKARQSLEEVIDQLKTNKEPPQEPSEQQIQQPAFKPEDIENLVLSKIEQRELAKKEGENFSVVMGKLQERHGNNYRNVLSQERDRLGLTDEDVNALARKSPEAFFRTFRLDVQNMDNNFQSPPRTQQRNDNFAPRTEKRTWSYYQKMKKDNPALYTSQQTQTQMMKDIIELKDEFKDGDWHSI